MEPLRIDIPKTIQLALDKLGKAGYEAYIVGGCVRDALLGVEPQDWDITTSAIPEEIQQIFNNYGQRDTGLKHGTVMIIFQNELIEITTFRIDHEYSDGRRPDSISYTSNVIEDLGRRDYTINACAMDGKQLVDPFGAREDIRNRLIRCVGDPVERFTEDSLRILRGIRFASTLNFTVEENTRRAMFECKGLLKNISWERIRVEFCKTLLGINVHDILIEFKDIISFMIPEIKEMIDFEQHNKYHVYDVYQHSLKAIELIDRDMVLRVTMFFHDIAKPISFSLDEEMIGHFYGHPKISAQITGKILKRMRFSNEDINTITQLIEFHNTEIGFTTKSVRRILSKLGEVQLRRLLKVKRADTMAKNPMFVAGGLETLDAIEGILDELIARDDCFTLADLKLDGYDLMGIGIPEGKKIGVILNKILDMVLKEEIENKREILMEKAKSLI